MKSGHGLIALIVYLYLFNMYLVQFHQNCKAEKWRYSTKLEINIYKHLRNFIPRLGKFMSVGISIVPRLGNIQALVGISFRFIFCWKKPKNTKKSPKTRKKSKKVNKNFFRGSEENWASVVFLSRFVSSQFFPSQIKLVR